MAIFRNAESLTRSVIDTIGNRFKQKIASDTKDNMELREAYEELDMCLDNFQNAPGKFREYWSLRITAAEARIQVLLHDRKTIKEVEH